MSDPILLSTEEQSATELPLVAAQPGIWVADQISPYANAYAVSHYIELNGPLNESLLLQAITQGLSEVDTLQLRFEERDGVPVQWHDSELAILPTEYLDLRDSPDAPAAAQAAMQLDMSGDLRIGSGKALYRHMVIRLSDRRWFWYQRYHHILVDGFSFTAIARRIAHIYSRILNDEQPDSTPFTPFSEVVAEYQRYQQSATCQRDAAFWLNKAQQLPAPATLCPQPLAGQTPTTRIHRLSQLCDRQDFAQLVSASQQQFSVADMA